MTAAEITASDALILAKLPAEGRPAWAEWLDANHGPVTPPKGDRREPAA